MTLGVMWVRSFARTGAELVCVTDSRLTGGKTWDGCPKILVPQRGDCLVAFGGDTDYAYPSMLHVQTTIDSYPDSRNRRFTLEKLRGHLERTLEQHLGRVDFGGRSSVPDEEVSIVLGGFSWDTQVWRIWSLDWDASTRRLRRRTRSPGRASHYHFFGDADIVQEANSRLRRHIQQRKLVNMEPLKIVRDIIREGEYASIGGPIQIAKVYRHLNARWFLVPWDDEDGTRRLSLAGRMLLGSETSVDLAEIDPDLPDVFEADSEI